MFVKTVGIISLSLGILGEPSTTHQLHLGTKRLEELNLKVKFLENSLKGVDFLKNNPQSRAIDLIEAFKDDDIDLILCAIGGDDTYKLTPYLFENDELQKVAKQKLFLGYSDTTINHLMLNKLGINTFYGQAFLPSICDLSPSMLPYTERYFRELIETGKIDKIIPSDFWYEDRRDFSVSAINTSMRSHKNNGFRHVNGNAIFSGKILGGCIESFYENVFNDERYPDSIEIVDKYKLFPDLASWQEKILLLESSDSSANIDYFRTMIRCLNKTGLFDVINGLIYGQTVNNLHSLEFDQILKEEISNKSLSIVTNINVGHSYPHCIVPFGVQATVDVIKQEIKFHY